MTTASRLSGVAPLSVFFDAVGSASGVTQPTGASPDYPSFYYKWNFADPNSGTWSVSGKNKNVAIGYVAAHVFETPGNYHVTLQVTSSNGTVTNYYQDITVTDPNVVYSGSTYYVSNVSGNDSNSGLTTGAPFKSVQKAMTTLFASNGPRRVLFKRGESWTTSTGVNVSGRTGPFTIGAYGSGTNPVIQVNHANDEIALDATVSDVRIMEIDLDGPYPSAAGTGIVFGGSHSLALRVKVSGFDTGIASLGTLCVANTVAESILIDNHHYSMFVGPLYDPTQINDSPIHLAVLGNFFDNSFSNSLLRTYVSRSLWESNLFLRAGQSATRLLGIGAPKKNAFVIIADNIFDSITAWVLEIGPENNTLAQVVENVIVERNKFYARGSVSTLLLIFCQKITVRNNIFDHTGADWSGSIDIFQRGIGPVPAAVNIYNNTVYRSDSAPTFGFVNAASSDLTQVRNNIVYIPAIAAGNVTLASGTVHVQNNLTTNPHFVNPGAGDFRLQSGSPAIDSGLTFPLREDYAGGSRPLGSGYDIGAYESY